MEQERPVNDGWTVRSGCEYLGALETHVRLLGVSEGRQRKVLWALGRLPDTPADHLDQSQRALGDQSGLFALAWTIFRLGCRASTARARAFLHAQFHRRYAGHRRTSL